jgi:hypothetical protein
MLGEHPDEHVAHRRVLARQTPQLRAAQDEGLAGSSAVTVAARSASVTTAISPKISPGPRIASATTSPKVVVMDVETSLGDEVDGVCRVDGGRRPRRADTCCGGEREDGTHVCARDAFEELHPCCVTRVTHAASQRRTTGAPPSLGTWSNGRRGGRDNDTTTTARMLMATAALAAVGPVRRRGEREACRHRRARRAPR